LGASADKIDAMNKLKEKHASEGIVPRVILKE